MLTDTHCHLDFPEFDADREEVIERTKNAGLDFIINVGSSLEGSKCAARLAEKYDFIYSSVGVHPHYAGELNDEGFCVLRNLAKKEKVVAVGEVGLDYFRNLSSPQAQREIFVKFIHLARVEKLPLIIHDRDAHQELEEILRAEAKRPLRGVVHCFSGDENLMKKFLDLGLHISFTANLTYKKSDGLREVAKLVPLDRLLLETDAPYLAPQHLRGKRNEPAYVKFLAEELARIKKIEVSKVARATNENARALFRI